LDERLSAALHVSNYSTIFANQKRIAETQLQNNLKYFVNKGAFTATPELISYCCALLSLKQQSVIMIDNNSNPILIENLKEFTDNVLAVRASALNEFFLKYTKLVNSRTVKSLVE
jgi:hypothetical protein